MNHDEWEQPADAIEGLRYVLDRARSQGSKRSAPCIETAITELSWLRAENLRLRREAASKKGE